MFSPCHKNKNKNNNKNKNCPTLPYVAPSYPKVGLNCSKAESRVRGGVVGWGDGGGVVQTNNRVKPNFS